MRYCFHFLTLSLLTIFCGFTGPVQAKTYYVDKSTTYSNASCLSWLVPCKTIEAALDRAAVSAETDDEIWVRYGTYGEAIEPASGVSIYGGFAGTETALSQRDPETNVTIIDGSTAGGGGPVDQVVRMVSVTDVLLDGFTITGGAADSGDYETTVGGGIYCMDVDNTNTISNCTITGNSGQWGGGGICLRESSLLLTDCIIRGNSASGGTGGGIKVEVEVPGDVSSPTIIDCIIRGNEASKGGGVECGLASPALIGCTISGNKASGGGGVYIYLGQATLTNCTISGNVSGSTGGGVELYGSYEGNYSTLTNCIISGNSASGNGGGVYNDETDSVLTNCTIAGNSAGSDGGGLFNDSGAPTLTNCIFENNTKRAVYLEDGNPAIRYGLFYNNPDGHYSGGVAPAFCIEDGDPKFAMDGPGTITGTWEAVFAHDASTDTTVLIDDQADFAPGSLAGQHLIPDGGQRLQALITENDAISVTVAGDWESLGGGETYLLADYHIRNDSSAIDGGTDTGAPSDDMDGDARPSGIRIDIGADEYNPAAFDGDNDGVVDESDLCPDDPDKTEPGECGCGTADTDTDGDGTPDCNDGCPDDDAKTEPGECGCGVADTDTDGDGILDCSDNCPDDPSKINPGACGCGVPDTDIDGDGTADCNDDDNNDGISDQDEEPDGDDGSAVSSGNGGGCFIGSILGGCEQ